MKELNAQRIVHSHIDPDEHDFLCISLENDIHNLVKQEKAKEAKIWEELVEEEKKAHQEEIAKLKRKARIVQLATRRQLKRVR